MIEKIIEYSIRNKFFVLLLTGVMIAAGIYCMINMPLDAIPDLSDVQVIIYTEYPGQAPQVVEDQVTYPLTTTMLAVPYAKVVRGYSFLGFSLVYIIFEDGTDLYWARSRVLEYLSAIQARLPDRARVQMGPDATGVGWVYEYALVSKDHTLQELRSLQDWFLRYELVSVEGVAEVASIGGYVKQYQVTVDPVRLQAYGLPLSQVKMAIQRTNIDVGGGVLEMSEREFMVRGIGYIQSKKDLEITPVGVDKKGTPILIREVADVALGPELRRGLAELDGKGEAAGGIVVMRIGENALATIERVKNKLEQIKTGLPEGVKIVPVYDRSRLILRAIDTLTRKLTEEMIVVALVCVVFLLHFRSAFVSIFTLPAGILVSFIIMYLLDINANIMSLGGIAIAIGVMVDASVVMVENAHKHLERARSGEGPGGDHNEIMIRAAKEVGPALFFSLVIITLAFLPVFTLQAQEGRLFRPLAFTKTFAMAASAVLAITIIPVLMTLFIRGRMPTEEKNPINRFFIWAYHPCIEFVLRYPRTVVLIAILITGLTWLPFKRLGSEFMPPLYEGDFLWMPTTDPGISITKAREILQQTDKIIASFPEVDHVFGKIGRAATSTDPAPLSMIETTLQLRSPEDWPQEREDRWYSRLPLPGWVKGQLGRIWPEHSPAMTPDALDRAINEAIQFPGLTNASMEGPIKIRLDMLSTGIRSPVGIKIAGPDLGVLQDLASEVATVLRSVSGTVSVYSDKAFGGYYLDIDIDRERAGRYGLQVEDVQDIILSAIGGMKITETVEGLERYPVNLRYGRDFRDNLEALGRVLVPTPRGEHIPLGQMATLRILQGPPVIKSENARLNAWIQINIRDVDLGTYVKAARQVVAERVEIPPGYTLKWSGRFEFMERAQQRLKVVVPLTLAIIFVLLYVHFRDVTETFIVLLSIPFAVVGGVWLMYFLGYNMSIAAGVGFIALAGLAVETGIVMLVYLDEVHERQKREGRLRSMKDVYEGIIEGAVMRVRPKLMTVATTFIGLLPVMIGNVFESGSSVMQRIAAPMVGGLITSTILTLLIIPAVYMVWKRWEFRQRFAASQKKS